MQFNDYYNSLRRKEKGELLREVCQVCAMSAATFSRRMDGNRFNPEEQRAICKLLQKPKCKLFPPELVINTGWPVNAFSFYLLYTLGTMPFNKIPELLNVDVDYFRFMLENPEVITEDHLTSLVLYLKAAGENIHEVDLMAAFGCCRNYFSESVWFNLIN